MTVTQPPETVTVVQAEPTAPPQESEPIEPEVAEPPPTEEAEPAEPASPPAPEDTAADVIQSKAGLAQDGENINYGVVLHNRSEAIDAINVNLTVNIVGGDGTILASDSDTINVIPAATTYYFGGATFVGASDQADSIETIIDIESSAPAAYPLPKVSSVRLEQDEFLGVEIRGQVENILDAPLSQFARVGIVVFDANDTVVAGASTYLSSDVPPGRKAAFNTYLFASPPNAVSAKATVENEISE